MAVFVMVRIILNVKKQILKDTHAVGEKYIGLFCKISLKWEKHFQGLNVIQNSKSLSATQKWTKIRHKIKH